MTVCLCVYVCPQQTHRAVHLCASVKHFFFQKLVFIGLVAKRACGIPLTGPCIWLCCTSHTHTPRRTCRYHPRPTNTDHNLLQSLYNVPHSHTLSVGLFLRPVGVFARHMCTRAVCGLLHGDRVGLPKIRIK